jgi:hypothetical protein
LRSSPLSQSVINLNMKFIKLMPDYNCHPLWHHKSKNVGDINPKRLPLSKGLINSLEQWAKTYDSTLNKEYPPDSVFVSSDEGQLF